MLKEGNALGLRGINRKRRTIIMMLNPLNLNIEKKTVLYIKYWPPRPNSMNQFALVLPGMGHYPGGHEPPFH